MNTAQEALAQAHNTLNEHFGTSASYYAPTESPIAQPCTVTINTTPDATVVGQLGPERQREALFLVKFSEVNLPQFTGTFVISSGLMAGIWTVSEVKPLTGGNWECTVRLHQSEGLGDPSAGHAGPLA